jgi:elongation factor Tu
MTSDPFFRMTIEDVFSIKGRGLVVTGQIEAGTLNLNDEINISRSGYPNRAVVVAGIEMFRKQLTQAKAGDNVGVLLRGLDKKEVQHGDTLMGV